MAINSPGVFANGSGGTFPIKMADRGHKCVQITERMTGAMEADESAMYETLAEQNVRDCSNSESARENSEVYAELALARIWNGKPKSSIDAAEKCVALDPTNPACQVQLSSAYFQMDLLESAHKYREVAYRLLETERRRIENEINRFVTSAQEGNSSRVRELLAKLNEHAASECYLRRMQFPGK